ncbi:hypothetical protein MSHRCOH1_06485 [Candidatus Ornithobacterium hominis]|nr:hypothetical protein MSHRCOH1_06485 [Candidatus Ornithobacterium hominis]
MKIKGRLTYTFSYHPVLGLNNNSGMGLKKKRATQLLLNITFIGN